MIIEIIDYILLKQHQPNLDFFFYFCQLFGPLKCPKKFLVTTLCQARKIPRWVQTIRRF